MNMSRSQKARHFINANNLHGAQSLKMMVAKLVKIFLTFHGTPRFTRAYSVPFTEPFESSPFPQTVFFLTKFNFTFLCTP